MVATRISTTWLSGSIDRARINDHGDQRRPLTHRIGREVVRSIDGLKPRYFQGRQGLYYEPWDRVALVLIHLRRRGPATEVLGYSG